VIAQTQGLLDQGARFRLISSQVRSKAVRANGQH
jgi:hypothetical protein